MELAEILIFEIINLELWIDETHWFNHAQDSLRGKLRQRDIETQAKNLIIYIGDGMSNPTVTAARIYKGQLEGQYGEEGSLYFETFPNIAMSKVNL